MHSPQGRLKIKQETVKILFQGLQKRAGVNNFNFISTSFHYTFPLNSIVTTLHCTLPLHSIIHYTFLLSIALFHTVFHCNYSPLHSSILYSIVTTLHCTLPLYSIVTTPHYTRLLYSIVTILHCTLPLYDLFCCIPL